jgi:hypothetical protein
MSILNTSLFATAHADSIKLGVGYHNIGSGVLRASHMDVIKRVEAHYGERCGHIPLEAEQVRILMPLHTPSTEAQIAYLSALTGKQIRAVTENELQQERQCYAEDAQTLVVPYINSPQADAYIQQMLHCEPWGIASSMVDVLKNKVSFYRLVDEFAIEGWRAPDYRVVYVADIPVAAIRFLHEIEEMLSAANLTQYPLGLMLRAAESDGNYGCCLLYEQQGRVYLIPNGDPNMCDSYPAWSEALENAQTILMETMDQTLESRVVMSRYIEFADSPGLSVVIMDDEVVSLRWNSQLQENGSKACVGTGSYWPPSSSLSYMRALYEEQTVTFFETLLRKTARRCGVDFATLRGLANIDIMLPSPMEAQLQRQRGWRNRGYLAECNPRWTNYTDAIMTVINANRQIPTVQQMRTTIERGILAVDCYEIPVDVDPQELRARIADVDEELKREGTRIICRMAKHPMGIILAGDLIRAQQVMADIVQETQDKSKL